MTDLSHSPGRRRLIAAGLGAAATAGFGGSALAQGTTFTHPFANGERKMALYPGKRSMIVLTSRPPQLETPFEVFNDGIITPNDAFFVRYHNAGIPTSVDPDTHVIRIGGNAAGKPFALSLADLKTKFQPVEIVAVNQCSGNSRARFEPRVTGGQLGDGAMGNARWLGVRLKDVLARAEVKNSAKQVTFDGLDNALRGGGDFVKALDMNQAMDPDVLIAWQMNGADLPMLNGFPVRLIVPGYYGTYWVKHLSQIDVVDEVFDGFWMRPAYRIPDNDCACVVPGTAPAATRPIGRFTVRSFITSVKQGQRVPVGATTVVRGIAFDGGQGIREVGISTDGGKSWRGASLGEELSRYSFREFTFAFVPDKPGAYDLRSCAWNRAGVGQPTTAVWQPAGYMRNVIESVQVTAA
ncbi:MAG: SorA family sulfite dehydrogenase catalytic subunit [Caldimonas sp.]